MGSKFTSDILAIDEYRFSLIWSLLEKVDETVDWKLIHGVIRWIFEA